MPRISVREIKDNYDVIIVGSGAGGGQAAYTLAMEGVKILMLEAGRDYDPTTETPMFQENFRAPLRAVGTPDKPYGFYDAGVAGGWKMADEPYTMGEQDPTRHMMWFRTRMLGGRTNHWSRVALRMGPYDFKPYSRDGLGFDWPVSYEEIAPYYEKVETLIGVYGPEEELENTPFGNKGVLLPPPPMRLAERLAQARVKPLGIPVLPARRAVLSRRLDGEAIAQKLHPGNAKAQRILAESIAARAACFWATPCERGCSIKANYQSTTVHLPPALATGNLDLVTDAMVRSVTTNTAGRATGVIFVDKKTGREASASGRVVILAASSYESVRILFNSKTNQFAEGLGNSGGVLGRNLVNTVGTFGGGQVPMLENMPPHNEDGAGGLHAYIPWWLYREQAAGKLGFARGYHIEFSGNRGMPPFGTGAGVASFSGVPYGAKLKAAARRYYGSFIGFSGRGEMIPNKYCFCEIDPEVKDRWGIPVLRFHWKWSEHEIRQAEHMQQTFKQIIEAMGGVVTDLRPRSAEGAIQPGGRIIHEVGGAMMGVSPKTSVLNKWGQTWDVKNLYVLDGAAFCSSPDKNPTLTIMALAWRSAERIMDEMKRGEI
ncbi:MAG TPA: GMC family oxidoreductase [Opitutaceae bacterium]|nr:GMC family oxidoreductase [Opitutaceae bacterium]